MLPNKNRQDQIDEFILFLDENKFDSINVEKFITRIRFNIILKKILGILFIIFALVVIVLPLPGSYEISTLFYFNPDDGITVSDLIAMVMLLFGIVLVVKDRIFYRTLLDKNI